MKYQVPEAFYKSLFDSMLDGLAYCQMLFDAQNRPIDFIYLEVNKNFESLTGLKDPVGKKVTSLIPGLKDSNPELFEIYGRVALTGKQERFETYIELLNRWFLVSAYSSSPHFFVAVFQNITNQKQLETNLERQKLAVLNVLEDLQSEKEKLDQAKTKIQNIANDLTKFKLATDSANDQIIITDPDATVIYVNKAVEKISGYSSDEAVGNKAGKLWGNLMPKSFYQKLWHTIKIDKKTFSGEITNQRKNGETYIAQISISPIFDEERNILFFVGIERDISNEKEIDKQKTEFVSLASHQLRTPLTSIRWNAELLQSENMLTPNVQKYSREIYDSILRMIDLVNSLLNVSLLDHGTLKIERKPIDFRQVTKTTISDLSVLISRRNVEVVETYDPNLAPYMGDDKIMKILVFNLLSNAIRYSHPGSEVKINVGTRAKGSEIGGRKLNLDCLTIEVADNGIGISKKQQKEIFTKMFRADNAQAMEPSGSGLGLYLVQQIVERIHGAVWFETQENKGTTFYIVLPASGTVEKSGTNRMT